MCVSVAVCVGLWGDGPRRHGPHRHHCQETLRALSRTRRYKVQTVCEPTSPHPYAHTHTHTHTHALPRLCTCVCASTNVVGTRRLTVVYTTASRPPQSTTTRLPRAKATHRCSHRGAPAWAPCAPATRTTHTDRTAPATRPSSHNSSATSSAAASDHRMAAQRETCRGVFGPARVMTAGVVRARARWTRGGTAYKRMNALPR